MKLRNLVMAVFAILLGFVFSVDNVYATPFTVTVNHSQATANVTMPQPIGTRTLYTEYTLNLQSYGSYEAFCVQAVWASGSPQEYALLPVPEDLYAAAWLAEQYWNTASPSNGQGTYQLAIWKQVLQDDFTYNSGNTSYVPALLEFGLPAGYVPINVAFMRNPVSGDEAGFQNFLIKHPNPVPEPATMLLLGFGLVGLAVIGRRNFIKK